MSRTSCESSLQGAEQIHKCSRVPYIFGDVMVQKVLEIVGLSKESFDDAAQNAISVCAKTVRDIRWARVKDMECKVEGDRIVEYRTLMRIYFDVEK